MIERWGSSLRHGRRRSARLRRELGIILFLIAIGALAFAGARTLARENEALKRQDARRWFARGGKALEDHQPEEALRALRRASAIDRNDRATQMLLARALRALHRDEEAGDVLSRLSTAQPADVDINLELARLEADRGEVAPAIRHYENAIDSLWTPEAAERQRGVRLELVKLLLKSGAKTRALAHLLVLSGDVPPGPSWHVTLGQFFLTADDTRRALEQFTSALEDEPSNPDALLGAGTAAFTRGNYLSARRYLSAVDTPEATELKASITAILTADPLAARLRQADRYARLLVLLRRARERVTACAATAALTSDAPSAASIDAAIQAALDASNPRHVRRAAELEGLEDGVDLAVRAERATSTCSGGTALDRAIPLIARAHGLTEAP